MDLEERIIEASIQMLKLGHNIGSEGNVSCKKNNIIFISPSGIKTSDLKKKDISRVDLNGKVLNNVKPSSEILLHLLIYRNFENIKAVVHCHSNWASTLSCMRKNIPAFHYMVAEFGGRDIKCSKYATFGSEKLSKYVNKALVDRKGCLIANHGQITIGESLEEAIDLSIALEKLSQQYFFCRMSKEVKILSDCEMKIIKDLFKNYKVKH